MYLFNVHTWDWPSKGLTLIRCFMVSKALSHIHYLIWSLQQPLSEAEVVRTIMEMSKCMWLICPEPCTSYKVEWGPSPDFWPFTESPFSLQTLVLVVVSPHTNLCQITLLLLDSLFSSIQKERVEPGDFWDAFQLWDSQAQISGWDHMQAFIYCGLWARESGHAQGEVRRGGSFIIVTFFIIWPQSSEVPSCKWNTVSP